MNGGELEGVKAYLVELGLVVCETAARTAEGECRTENYGITDSLGRRLRFLDAVGYLRGNGGLTDRLAELLEKLSVLGSFYTLATRTEKLGVALLENTLLLELHSEVKTGLSAYTGNDSVRTLVAQNLCNVFERKRLHIHLICYSGVGHNGCGVGVYEYNLVALFFERKARLCTCVIELCGLTYNDRTGADYHNSFDVSSLCHIYILLIFKQG